MGKYKSLRCSAAKGKDPVKPHVKLGKPLTFLLSGANFGVEIYSAWYQDASKKAGILLCSPGLSIVNFLETDAGFVWVEVAGVLVCSRYFSPNDPFEIFETQILLLEKASERLVGGPLLRRL